MFFSQQLWKRKAIPAGILATSVAALGGTLALQFGLDLMPCILCLCQRLLYAVAAILAAIALCLSPQYLRVFVGLCGITFGLNTIVAFYQIGAEYHWWYTATCASSAEPVLSLAELHLSLERPAETPCAEVQWSLFGLSLSGYNLPASLGLAMFCLVVAKRKTW